MMKKSQTSLEITVISGMLLIIFLIFFIANSDISFVFSSKFSNDQINLALKEIGSAAENVYYQGVGASTVIFISIPDNVANSSIVGRTIFFETYSITGDNISNTMYKTFNFNVNGTLPKSGGNYNILIKAEEGYVNITTT